jgi:hypothetical protein
MKQQQQQTQSFSMDTAIPVAPVGPSVVRVSYQPFHPFDGGNLKLENHADGHATLVMDAADPSHVMLWTGDDTDAAWRILYSYTDPSARNNGEMCKKAWKPTKTLRLLDATSLAHIRPAVARIVKSIEASARAISVRTEEAALLAVATDDTDSLWNTMSLRLAAVRYLVAQYKLDGAVIGLSWNGLPHAPEDSDKRQAVYLPKKLFWTALSVVKTGGCQKLYGMVAQQRKRFAGSRGVFALHCDGPLFTDACVKRDSAAAPVKLALGSDSASLPVAAVPEEFFFYGRVGLPFLGMEDMASVAERRQKRKSIQSTESTKSALASYFAKMSEADRKRFAGDDGVPDLGDELAERTAAYDEEAEARISSDNIYLLTANTHGAWSARQKQWPEEPTGYLTLHSMRVLDLRFLDTSSASSIGGRLRQATDAIFTHSSADNKMMETYEALRELVLSDAVRAHAVAVRYVHDAATGASVDALIVFKHTAADGAAETLVSLDTVPGQVVKTGRALAIEKAKLKITAAVAKGLTPAATAQAVATPENTELALHTVSPAVPVAEQPAVAEQSAAEIIPEPNSNVGESAAKRRNAVARKLTAYRPSFEIIIGSIAKSLSEYVKESADNLANDEEAVKAGYDWLIRWLAAYAKNNLFDVMARDIYSELLARVSSDADEIDRAIDAEAPDVFVGVITRELVTLAASGDRNLSEDSIMAVKDVLNEFREEAQRFPDITAIDFRKKVDLPRNTLMRDDKSEVWKKLEEWHTDPYNANWPLIGQNSDTRRTLGQYRNSARRVFMSMVLPEDAKKPAALKPFAQTPLLLVIGADNDYTNDQIQAIAGALTTGQGGVEHATVFPPQDSLPFRMQLNASLLLDPIADVKAGIKWNESMPTPSDIGGSDLIPFAKEKLGYDFLFRSGWLSGTGGRSLAELGYEEKKKYDSASWFSWSAGLVDRINEAQRVVADADELMNGDSLDLIRTIITPYVHSNDVGPVKLTLEFAASRGFSGFTFEVARSAWEPSPGAFSAIKFVRFAALATPEGLYPNDPAVFGELEKALRS